MVNMNLFLEMNIYHLKSFATETFMYGLFQVLRESCKYCFLELVISYINENFEQGKYYS